MSAADRLDHLRRTYAEGCRRCRLHKNRNRLVFGVGCPEAPIVLAGEAPGRDENLEGEPFVGPAGQILDGFLRRLEIPRDSPHVYILNAIKCWPGPGNPTPESVELAACAPLLHIQLRIIRPRVIVALGRTAATILTGKTLSVAQFREKTQVYSNDVTGFSCPVVTTYHPSYILRQTGGNQDKIAVKEDARKVVGDLQRAKEMTCPEGCVGRT